VVIEIIRDVQIKPAIAVEIDKCARGAPQRVIDPG